MQRGGFHCLIAAIALLHVVAATSSSAAPLVVKTKQGLISGLYEGDTRAFLGVPFASPPIRFAPPVPPTQWDEVKEATTMPQPCADGKKGSEDCLYLNVFTPKSVPINATLPVMVWIHGGCYLGGGAYDYPGYNLASGTQSIVVVIQYRLSILAWYASTLMKESGLNLGFLDQNLALCWVHENIASFGGDPNRVLIFGQSAGGGSVAAHLIMKASWPYFSAAVLESPDSQNAAGICTYFPLDVALNRSKWYESKVGCTNSTPEDVMECMRSQPLANIFPDIQPPSSLGLPFDFGVWNLWGPIIDGHDFYDYPLNMFKAGNFKKVPTIIGSSKCENCWDTNTAWGCPRPITEAEKEDRLHLIFGNMTSVVKSHYAAYDKEYGSWFSTARAQSDFSYNCPQYATANAIATHTKTWFFWWNHVTKSWPQRCMNATHAGEIGYLFMDPTRVLGWFGYQKFTKEETDLSVKIAKSWYALGAHGDPNMAEALGFEWPRYTPGSQDPVLLSLSTPPKLMEFPLQDNCRFWASIEPWIGPFPPAP